MKLARRGAVRSEFASIDFPEALASCVHDIKNSIMLLIHSAEKLYATLPEGTSTGATASELHYEARRINHDLIHLLGLFKLEREQQTVTPETVATVEFLEELRTYNESLFSARNTAFEIVDAAPGEAFFDRNLVLGIMNSAINSAMVYASGRVQLTARMEPGFAVLAVCDDGDGFPPRMLVDPASITAMTDYPKGRTGLGLFFAQHVASLHRHRGATGRVALSNEGIDGGGRFEIWLPC